jgi:hypothetical protein
LTVLKTLPVKKLNACLVAVVLNGVLFGAVCPISHAQGLPQTNYGKFVHKPGDNQYEYQAQHERHAPPPAPVHYAGRPMGGGGGYGGGDGGGYTYHFAPAPVLPDTSIQPIISDEPIRPAGFPPLPDRLDLPSAAIWSRPSAQAVAQKASFDPILGVHEHYVHVMPGYKGKQEQQAQAPASAPAQTAYGGSDQNCAPAAPAQPAFNNPPPAPQTHGYYKCGTPPSLGSRSAPSDYYGSNSGGAAPSAGAASGVVRQREPRLNGRNDVLQQPDAPAPLVVNQSTVQDLSLPEDDQANQNPTTKNTGGKNVVRGFQRGVSNAVHRVESQMYYTGMGAMGGMGHF